MNIVSMVAIATLIMGLPTIKPEMDVETRKFCAWIHSYCNFNNSDIISGRVSVFGKPKIIFREVTPKSDAATLSREFCDFARRRILVSGANEASLTMYYLQRFSSKKVDAIYDEVVSFSPEIFAASPKVAFPRHRADGSTYSNDERLEEILLFCLSRRHNRPFSSLEKYRIWKAGD